MAVKRDTALDAERAVLGALLIDSGIARDVMSKVDGKDFLLPENQKIFQAIRALFRAGEPIDPITIRGKLGNEYTEYLIQLMEVTPTSANWKEYAKIMHEQATLQRVRDLAAALSESDSLAACRGAVADLGQLLADGRKVDSWNMAQMLEDFFTAQDPNAPPPEYVTTGIREVDSGTFSQLGDVMMIGGSPSAGKTALALQMAYHMAEKYKVGFFSLETNKQKVRDRLMSYVGQIEFNEIKRKHLSEKDWNALATKSGDMSKRDFTVLVAGGMTATEIQAVSQAYGFQVIFIDYVQLVAPETDRRSGRTEQMADVSRSLHTFAQKSGTLVVELAQLSRQDKSSGWREPDMHDLKETGQFEQDADIIYLVYRPNPKDKDLDQESNRILKIAKNKEGRWGKWPMYFDGGKQTFSTLVQDASKSIMREMIAGGKAIKAKRRAAANRQTSFWDGPEFKEIPEFEGNPFAKKEGDAG